MAGPSTSGAQLPLKKSRCHASVPVLPLGSNPALALLHLKHNVSCRSQLHSQTLLVQHCLGCIPCSICIVTSKRRHSLHTVVGCCHQVSTQRHAFILEPSTGAGHVSLGLYASRRLTYLVRPRSGTSPLLAAKMMCSGPTAAGCRKAPAHRAIRLQPCLPAAQLAPARALC